MQLPILVSEAEAETVIFFFFCFVFLLSNSPRFRTPCSQTQTGIYGLLCGGDGGVRGGVG